jgi:hypothetical protein
MKIRQARQNELLNGTAQFCKGGQHPFARKVSTPNGVFETLKEAGIFYKVRGSKVREWIKKGKDGFLFSSPLKVRNEPKKRGAYLVQTIVLQELLSLPEVDSELLKRLHFV